MAQSIADRRDIDFVLHELLQVETLSEHEQFYLVVFSYLYIQFTSIVNTFGLITFFFNNAGQ